MAGGPEDNEASPQEADDRAAVDRAFAELVAGYHLTADRPEPASRPESTSRPEAAEPSPAAADVGWADVHPLFRFEEPAAPQVVDPPVVDEHYEPEPLPPLARPALPALLGWIGIGIAVLVVLGATLGMPIPAWLGWAAVGCFLTGFGILIIRLPRHRDPDAGNGAVL